MDLHELADVSYRIYDHFGELKDRFKYYKIERFQAGDVVATVLTDISAFYTSVVFRGTAEIATAARDLDIRFCKFSPGRAHEGFAGGLAALWPEIFDRLIELDPKTRVNFAGHSFGAAVAGLAAFRYDVLRDQSPELPEVSTVCLLGCPRFADIALRNEYNRRLGNKTYRIVNESDPVTLIPLPGIPWIRLPFFRLTYRHVGKFAWLMESLNGSTLFRRRTDWISWLNVTRRAIGDINNDILDDHSAETYYQKLAILARQCHPKSVRDTLYPELA